MERGPKGGFEAGQPINTDDAMNDMPQNAFDTFTQKIQDKVNTGVYTQEQADALIEKTNARRAEKAEAEQKAAEDAASNEAYQAWANMTPEESAERSTDFTVNFAGETNTNSATGKVRTDSVFDRFPRNPGESNEDYSARLARMKEVTAKFLEEHPEPADEKEDAANDPYKEMVEKRVESGDLKREEADEMLARREKQIAEKEKIAAEEARNEEAIARENEKQDKLAMEMADKIRKNVPEALELLEKHPEIKVNMAVAVKKLEELDEISKANDEANTQIDAELAKRNETFMKAVEAFNTAARANEAARAKMAEFEKKGTGTNEEYQEILDEIHKTENDQAKAQEDKEKAETDYNEAEAKIRENQDKIVAEANERMAIRDEYAAKNDEQFSKDYAEARATYETAKQLNADARAELADLEQRADKGEKITNEMFKAAEDKIHASEEMMAGSEARMNELKEGQEAAANNLEDVVNAEIKKRAGAEKAEVGEGAEGAEAGEGAEGAEAGEGAEADKAEGAEGAEAGEGAEAEKSAETEDEEWNKFLDSYISDPDFRDIYTRNGVFDEESCKGAIRNMYEALKRQNAEAEKSEEKEAATEKDDAEGEEGEENPDDGFETAEQRGLFAKLKDFFKGNSRSKEGAKDAFKEQGGMNKIKRFALAGLYSLMIFMTLGSALNVNAPDKKAEQTAGENAVPNTVYAAENTVEAADADDLVARAAEDVSLKVDLNAEKGEELSDLVDTTSYKENIEVNISYGDYDGSTEFLDYEEKHGRHNLTKELYDMDNETLTDVQKAEQIAEGLANVLDDPIEQGQFAALGGADVSIDGKVDGITSLQDMNEVLDLASQDDEFRIALADYNKEMYRDLVDNYDLQVEHRDKGSYHRSLYAYEMQLEDGTSDINYAIDKDGVLAREDFDVLQFMDEEGQNILDNNDIGGYKYNFLKGIGIIPEDATDKEAQDIMSKIRIIGFSGKCGQLIWENVTPNTGEEKAGNETGTEKEGDEGTGTEKEGNETGTEKEGDEGTGTEKEGNETGTEKEGNETGTEKEGDETGTEKEGDETGTEKEGNETGTEKEGSETGTEKEGIETGTEKEGDETGTEKEGDETGDGKTDILPGEDNDGWTQEGPTQEETGPTTEAERTPVDDGGNGFVNDNNPGDSSQLAQDDFLNGGDQGGGNTDADGGGSTDTDTEATYDGSDTSGWQGNDQSEEPGTQDVPEASTPEEVNAINDSEANPESAGEDVTEPEAVQEDHDEIMDRLG